MKTILLIGNGFDLGHGLPTRFDDFIDSNPYLYRNKYDVFRNGNNWKDYEKDHFYKAGNEMDEHGRGGFRAIWAEQLVELGADESLPQITEQIKIALDAFRGALEYSSPDDFSKEATFRGEPCRYYIKGATFPAANHIRILENTISWRTEENLAMVKSSYAHCKEIMKDYRSVMEKEGEHRL